MSTPTTIKFQIAVPSNVNGEAIEKVYTLTLSLLVEGRAEGEIKVTPLLAAESDPAMEDHGAVPVIPDPPDSSDPLQPN